jgi:hypothetical protein
MLQNYGQAGLRLRLPYYLLHVHTAGRKTLERDISRRIFADARNETYATAKGRQIVRHDRG